MPTHKQIIKNFSIEPMEGEIFKPIPGVKSHEISNYGRVLVKRKKVVSKICTYYHKPKIIMPANNRGFSIKGKYYSVASCVYKAFKGDYDKNKYVIKHINRVIFDNRIENLEITTRAKLASDTNKGRYGRPRNYLCK